MAYISAGSLQNGGSSTFVETFLDATDYTSGTTTQLTLANTPASENTVWVMFDGVVQHHTEYSISANVITFTIAIPLGTNEIEVQNNTQLNLAVAGDDTITTAKIVDGAVTAIKLSDTYIGTVIEDTTPVLGGALDALNNDIDNAKTVTFNTEIANTGTGAQTVDWTVGQKQKFTLTGATTITFTAPLGISNMVLKLINAGTDITWGTAILWPGGAEPTWTTTGTDILSLYYDGTSYYGMAGIAFA